MSAATLVMDKAGRVVIPKSLRKELHLQPGDSLSLEISGEQITLRPVRDTPPLIKEKGVWVVPATGNFITVEDVNKMIEEDRLQREETDLRNLK